MSRVGDYLAADIQVLTGLDPVRKRPGMYTNTASPDYLAQEVIDNSVDEAIAGFADSIEVTVYEDGSLSVVDNGRGMPVDIHPEYDKPGVELILTTLHAGAKFGGRNYQHSGGLHGVGVSVVNALSQVLETDIRREGHIWRIGFRDGETVAPLRIAGTCGKRQTGTAVRFKPDGKYFDSAEFSASWLKSLLRAKAVLLPGLKTSLKILPDREFSWQYEDGLQDYLAETLSADAEVIPTSPLVQHAGDELGKVDWALVWTSGQSDLTTASYVNLVPTRYGGTHVNGFRTAILDAVREYCEFRNLLPRGVKLTVEDATRNCAWILSAHIQEPRFSGQTKERLTSRECSKMVSGLVKDRLSAWLLKHTSEGNRIAELVVENAQQRQRSLKTAERKRATGGIALPGKLADCISTDVEKTELFLVEGDSAGGSARQARDRNFQAILPLRGKILNAWEADTDGAMASREVRDISVAIGMAPGDQLELNKLRYGRICILADADPDGRHIATLLCALFMRHFRPLVESGRIFVVMPPLYRISAGDELRYALDEQERDQMARELSGSQGKKIEVQRFKGLGEMNPAQLRHTAMMPDSRRLVQLTLDGGSETNEILDLLLAKGKANERRQWLEEHGNRPGIQSAAMSGEYESNDKVQPRVAPELENDRDEDVKSDDKKNAEDQTYAPDSSGELQLGFSV